MNEQAELQPVDAEIPAVPEVAAAAVRTPWTEFWRKFRKQAIGYFS